MSNFPTGRQHATGPEHAALIRLARVAAYRLRVIERGERHFTGKHLSDQVGDAGPDIFEEPLTFGECVSALESPGILEKLNVSGMTRLTPSHLEMSMQELIAMTSRIVATESEDDDY